MALSSNRKLTADQVLSDYQQACQKYHLTMEKAQDEHFEDSEEYQKIKERALKEFQRLEENIFYPNEF